MHEHRLIIGVDYEPLKPRLAKLIKEHEKDVKLANELEKRVARLIERHVTHVCYHFHDIRQDIYKENLCRLMHYRNYLLPGTTHCWKQRAGLTSSKGTRRSDRDLDWSLDYCQVRFPL